jgi:hypothetical protein
MNSSNFWDATPYECQSTFRRKISPPSLRSESKKKISKKPAWSRQLLGLLFDPFADRILYTEAICSSETSADFHRTTLCHIPENRIVHNHHCFNICLSEEFGPTHISNSIWGFLSFTGFVAVFTIRSATRRHIQGLVHFAHSYSTVRPTDPYISSMVGLSLYLPFG